MPVSVALLADRDTDTRKMYAEVLKSSYAIEEADDGRDALVKAIVRQPQVLITETRLLGIDGYELCHLLRADAATRDMTIVFVTGDAYERDVQHAQQVGADAVLVKPCLPDLVLNEVQRLTQLSAELRERARALRHRLADQLERSNRALQRSHEVYRRQTLSRTFARQETINPPSAPPVLVCPSCDQALLYKRSHIGGVNAQNVEQWDYYECPNCGEFQYRHRTRKLRRVS